MIETVKSRVAIIGTGNIGTDLCYRLIRDKRFEVVALVGRRSDSPGLDMFKDDVPNLVSNGIEGLTPILGSIQGVFDASSAYNHKQHWEVLETSNKWVIDLTPSKIGEYVVPYHSLKAKSKSINLITCGGQSSIPLII